MVAESAQGADVRLFAHYPMRDTLTILFHQSFPDRQVTTLFPLRPQIIRFIVKLWSDSFRRNQTLNFYLASRSWVQAFQFLFVEDHKGSRRDFKALLNLFAGDFFAAFGIDHMLLDSSLRPLIQDVKANR